MRNLMNAIKDVFTSRTNGMSEEEYYYSQSYDLVDLERRMKQVHNGTAPFQRGYGIY